MIVVCPVDQTSNDLQEQRNCRQCGSDLRPLVLLETIKEGLRPPTASEPERLPSTWKQGGLQRKTGIWAVVAVALVSLGAGLGRRIPLRPRNIQAATQAPLEANPLTRSLGLQVRQDGSISKVVGKVPSEAHRQLVLALLKDSGPLDSSQLTLLPSPPRPGLKYRVRPGDSWWLITKRIHGTGKGWQRLQDANPDAGALSPGQSILIPAD